MRVTKKLGEQAKLAEIVMDIPELPREAKSVEDIPLGPRAPAPARNVEIVSQPQAQEPWRKHRRAVPEAIEAIPLSEPAKVESRDYRQAAQVANRASREGKRRVVGRKAVSQGERVEIAQALVSGLRRKDR
jgi:hypothetical protein